MSEKFKVSFSRDGLRVKTVEDADDNDGDCFPIARVFARCIEGAEHEIPRLTMVLAAIVEHILGGEERRLESHITSIREAEESFINAASRLVTAWEETYDGKSPGASP